MNKYNILISKKQAEILLELLDENNIEDKILISSLSKVFNNSSSEITNTGKDIKDTTVKNSKNHNIIKDIHLSCFPSHRINQNIYLSLDMNGRQKKCEFDIYDKTFNLLIEIHGNQHYKFTPFFHKDKSDFIMQQVRDEEKKKWAIVNGYIYLAIAEKDVLNMNKLFKNNRNSVQKTWIQLIKNNIEISNNIEKELLEEQ